LAFPSIRSPRLTFQSRRDVGSYSLHGSPHLRSAFHVSRVSYSTSLMLLGGSFASRCRRRMACQAFKTVPIPPPCSDGDGGLVEDSETSVLPVLPLPQILVPGFEYRILLSAPIPKKLLEHILMTGNPFVATLVSGSSVAAYGVLLRLIKVECITYRNQEVRLCTVSAEGRVRLLSIHDTSAWHEKTSFFRASCRRLECTDSSTTMDKLRIRSPTLAKRLCRERCTTSDEQLLQGLRQRLDHIVTMQEELEDCGRLQPCVRNFAGFWELCGIWSTFMESKLKERTAADAIELMRARKGKEAPLSSIPSKDIFQKANSMNKDLYEQIRSQVQNMLETCSKRRRAEMLGSLIAHETDRLMAIKSVRDALK